MSDQERYTREGLEKLSLEELRSILEAQTGGRVFIMGLTRKMQRESAIIDILRYQDQ